MEKSADAFRTISEVADDLTLPQHVLRFWETRFSQIRPLKRAGGRRYYRPADVALLKTIRQLLYDDGYTIKGVQRLLKEQGQKTLVDQTPADHAPAEAFEPSLEDEPVELQTLSFGEPVQDEPCDDEPPLPDEPSGDGVPSQSRVVAIYESRALATGNAISSPAETPREIGREALLEAITTIDECLRILAVARRATT